MAPIKEQAPVAGTAQADKDIEARLPALRGDLPGSEAESQGYNPYDNPGPPPAAAEE